MLVRYKCYYDQGTQETRLRVGDWVLIRFPAEETGARRKLSHPWHGPYRVTGIDNQNATAIKVYIPQEDALHIHLSRVRPAPVTFQLVTTAMGDLAVDLAAPLSGLTLSQKILRNLATTSGVAPLQHQTPLGSSSLKGRSDVIEATSDPP